MSARALILGLDGATFDVIDALGDRLPNLSRLAREGARAPLNSTTPPMTLPAWSSVLTGCQPGKHGFYAFTARAGYYLSFTNSPHRRVPTMHRLLAARGRRVGCIAVPTTFPPEEDAGVVVSGFDSPVATGISHAHCAPPELYDEIRARFGGMAFADFQEGDIGPGWHEVALGALLQEIGRKEAICGWLLDREAWDLFMVVFGESDTVAHHFWMFHDGNSPRFRPGMEDAIASVYARLDAMVGVLAARAQVVCVVSDHGFGGAGDIALYLNRFLESKGWLTYKSTAAFGVVGDAIRRAATRLPIEEIVRRTPAILLGRVETATRYGDVDFSRTRAWSDEMNYAATLHLNLRGREVSGFDFDVDALIADLLAWEVEGRRVVMRVDMADEIYGPARAPGGPDLVLTLALRDGYSSTLLPSSRVAKGTTWRRLEPPEHVGGKGLGTNGSHRQHGVFLLCGVGVRAGIRLDAGVADVLPTIFALLGEPIPEHVDGHVLADAVSARAVWTEDKLPVAGARALDANAARDVHGRLRRLGYL